MSKDSIKQAARDLFDRYSYVKTSVSDIASAAGIGKGTIYLSFKTKEDILYALISDDITAMKTRTEGYFLDPSHDLFAKIEQFSLNLVEMHFHIRDLMFGAFENVEGRDLKDVYLKFETYIDQVSVYLSTVLGLHGYAGDRTLRVREFILFLSGRIIIHILSHHWNDREEILRQMPIWADQIFSTIVLKESE